MTRQRPIDRAALRLALALLLGALMTGDARAVLTGRVVRVVENPFDPVKRIGFGLADDGTYLYATAVDDGIIRVIDRQSLAVIREITTPARFPHALNRLARIWDKWLKEELTVTCVDG
jgi:hypothetical protein